jgi:hypothetical protein
LKKPVRPLTLRQRRLKKLLEQGGKIEYVRLKGEPKPNCSGDGSHGSVMAFKA